MKHDAAVLALFFADLRRRHLVDCLAAGAFDLLGSCNELQHGSAVVTDQMGTRHRGDSSGNRQFTIGEVDEQVLVLRSNLVTLQLHCVSYL